MTTPLTPEALAEIRARHAASTPGKWIVGGPWPTVSVYVDGADSDVEQPTGICVVYQMTDSAYPPPPLALADATFIAHAPEDVDALLSEVIRLQAENEQLATDRDRARESHEWEMRARAVCLAENSLLRAELSRYTAHRETGFQGRGE